LEGQDEPFLKPSGVRVAKAITKKFIEPHGDMDTVGPRGYTLYLFKF